MNIEKIKLDAQSGDPVAQCELGKILLHIDYDGSDIEKNPTEGVKWLTAAASQGHAEAEFDLGLCSLYGIGCAKDLKAAFAYTVSGE